MALPMLTRQIEGLKLLQKTRKPGNSTDSEKRVTDNPMAPFPLSNMFRLLMSPLTHSGFIGT